MGDHAAFDVPVQGEEFEVEDIIQYRQHSNGEEYFLVKWAGYPLSEVTWEPFRHMNANCREIIAKARALCPKNKPFSGAEEKEAALSPIGSPEVQETLQPFVEVVEEIDDDPEPAIGLGESLHEAPAPELVSAPNNAVDEAQRLDIKRKASEAPTEQSAAKRARLDPNAGEGSIREKGVIPSAERDQCIVCKVCSSELHPECAEDAIPNDYVCPPCRLERVDDFHPPVGPGLLRHSIASASATFSLDFAAQTNVWKKQGWNVHLRAVSLRSHQLGGPAWPHKVTGKLNNRQCVAIDPPKHLHIRREQCYNLTPLLRQGVNYLEMRFTPNPEQQDEPEESYCVGVVLTRPRSVPSIISRIRARSKETESSGRQRIERLLAQINWKEQGEEECMVTGTFGRSLRPVCPVSFCPIEEAAIGRNCNHVQVFDLQAYIAVNQRMRSLDKRWTCPVCSLTLRPDDLMLDPFCQAILEQIRGEEDTMDAIVFNEDCSWSAVSDVQEDKERPGSVDVAAGNVSAEMIDLSDSD